MEKIGRILLQQAKIDFKLNPHGYRNAIEAARPEAPFRGGFDGLFVEAHAELFRDLEILATSAQGHDAASR